MSKCPRMIRLCSLWPWPIPDIHKLCHSCPNWCPLEVDRIDKQWMIESEEGRRSYLKPLRLANLPADQRRPAVDDCNCWAVGCECNHCENESGNDDKYQLAVVPLLLLRQLLDWKRWPKLKRKQKRRLIDWVVAEELISDPDCHELIVTDLGSENVNLCRKLVAVVGLGTTFVVLVDRCHGAQRRPST